MMKITLISFYFINPGVRYISSYLKARGYDVEIVFMRPKEMYDSKEEYTKKALDDLTDICRDSSLVGLSVMTNDFFRACSVTRHLKASVKAPLIWGGIHPSIDPDSCPVEADYIYVGEGEAGMLEIAQRIGEGRAISDVANVYYRQAGGVRRNRLRPLLKGEDLGHFQDFEIETHFVLQGERIEPVTYDFVKNNFTPDFENDEPAYLAVFSRGCVHGCTYCCNNRLNRLYGFEQTVYRTKTPRHMIEELKYILRKFPFVKFIYINDDNFLANGLDVLGEFARSYAAEIALPFKVLGSAVYVTEEKIRTLKAAGLKEIHIGVQSGSDRTNREIYKRAIPGRHVLRTAELIHKYDLRGRYDFIFDNPYEKMEDELATARFILKLPKPYILQPFSLTFFPGTELYDKAKADGMLVDERAQVFEKVSNRFYVENVTYLKLVSVLLSRMPRYLGAFLISRPMVFAFHRKALKGFYRKVYQLLYWFKERFNISVRSLYKK